MSKKILKTGILMLLLVCLLATNALAASTTTGGATVTADSLNLRTGAGTGYAVETTLPKNSFLLVTGSEGIWYKVMYNGVEGYVSSYFVDFSTTLDGSYSVKGTVEGTSVRLRAGASTSSGILGYCNTGDEVSILGVSGEWIKVSTASGQTGYLHSQYINCLSGSSAEYVTIGTVKGSGVRLRAEASTSSAILGYYNTGARFTVLDQSGTWKKVQTSSGTVGYIHGDYLVITTEQVSSGSSSLTLGEQLVATAKNYLGVPYVWGGMSTSGFDCSGFVNYVYKLHGYSLYRVAQDIYSNNGWYVDKSELQPGDIIAFGYSSSSITHVGIYIGNGQFIHASSGSGKVVITDLSSNYYTRMYVGAKRVIG